VAYLGTYLKVKLTIFNLQGSIQLGSFMMILARGWIALSPDIQPRGSQWSGNGVASHAG